MPEDDIPGEEETDQAGEPEEDPKETVQDLDDRLVVEGVIFSAERPMRVVDIEEATGFERRKVTKALRRLASDYRRRNTSIEVVKVGSRWTMQVRSEYTPTVRSVATPEVDPKYLRTLALIAYHQPMLQSDLQQMLGPKVYDHVRELKALGLINARRKGATLELTTTQRFPEYFGIESAKREDIKRFMAERAGIDLGAAEPPRGAVGSTGDEGTEPEGAEPAGTEPETPDPGAPETEPEEDQV